MRELDELIAETEAVLQAFRRAGRSIDAAACVIRLKALRDAKDAISTLEE